MCRIIHLPNACKISFCVRKAFYPTPGKLPRGKNGGKERPQFTPSGSFARLYQFLVREPDSLPGFDTIPVGSFFTPPGPKAPDTRAFLGNGTVNHYAQNSMQAVKEKSCQAMEESQRVASRCFMFMYFLFPHWVPATWRRRAQTSIRAELPSGKVPTTRVRLRISRLRRSMTLFVRIRVQGSIPNSV